MQWSETNLFNNVVDVSDANALELLRFAWTSQVVIFSFFAILFVCLYLVSLLGAFRKFRKAIIFSSSVCVSAWNRSSPTRRILIKFDIWAFLKNSVYKIQAFFSIWQERRVLYMKTFYKYRNISVNSSYKEKCVI
jgi:hypothetical protein